MDCIAHQASLSMRFSRQEYWSGLPYPPPEDLSNPGIKPTSLMSPALAGIFFISSAAWEAQKLIDIVAVVPCLVTQSCLTLCHPMDCSTPGFPVLHHLLELLKLMSIESVMPSNHLIFCCPFLLLSSVFPSIRVFSNESALYLRWPKYWSFSFNISPSSVYSGLISFRMGWFDLLAVHGTHRSLLQHQNLKASILWHSACFMVQLSHPYMTTGKTIALTRQTFDGKVMSLLFNILSRLVITFLPRSKHLLILWLQSPSALIL